MVFPWFSYGFSSPMAAPVVATKAMGRVLSCCATEAPKAPELVAAGAGKRGVKGWWRLIEMMCVYTYYIYIYVYIYIYIYVYR